MKKTNSINFIYNIFIILVFLHMFAEKLLNKNYIFCADMFPSVQSSCIQNHVPFRQIWKYTLVHCEKASSVINYHSGKFVYWRKFSYTSQASEFFQILNSHWKSRSHTLLIYICLVWCVQKNPNTQRHHITAWFGWARLQTITKVSHKISYTLSCHYYSLCRTNVVIEPRGSN
jgi:hypothetical protein